MRLTLAALFFACPLAQAQLAIPTEFPSDAMPIAADALRLRLVDKVFGAKMADGSVWRFEYKSNGFFFLNAGSYSDSGKWKTQDGKVCAEMQKSGAACSEIRVLGDTLFMKRASNGEVATLVAH